MNALSTPRYELIKPALERYKRRFSVLDLGAGINQPTLGWMIANEFDAIVTVIEKDLYVQHLEQSPRVIQIRHKMTAADLWRLNECEHFDVVLALNVLHWFEDDDWLLAAKAVCAMGDFVFVQLPALDEDRDGLPGRTILPSLTQRILSRNPHHLGDTVQFPRHTPRPLLELRNGIKKLTRTSWTSHDNSANTDVYSTDHALGAQMKDKTKRYKDWIPGINLWNFCQLGGVWPSRDRIIELLKGHRDEHPIHGDIQPWNFVLDGEQLHLIDGGDAWGVPEHDQMNLERTIEEVGKCLS